MNVKMTPRDVVPVLRRMARVWTLFVVVLATLVSVVPDPHLIRPNPPAEWLLPFFMIGGAVIGSLVAWRREGLGSCIILTGFVASIIGYRVLRGEWVPWAAVCVMALLMATPGLLFGTCAWLTRRRVRHTPVPTRRPGPRAAPQSPARLHNGERPHPA